jgi:hypothetical protein
MLCNVLGWACGTSRHDGWSKLRLEQQLTTAIAYIVRNCMSTNIMFAPAGAQEP